MFGLLRRLLGLPGKPDAHDIVHETWGTSFRRFTRHRFAPERGAGYEASIADRAHRLTLKRKDLFAWVDNPLYRYHNLTLRAKVQFADPGTYGALGFLIRHADDANYYYFLVSSRGYFRFDAVFNGNPVSLIPWTECDVPDGSFDLRLVARGSSFVFLMNEDWLGEVEDDRVQAGGISFAAQNYGDTDTLSVLLHEIRLDSRPLEVEAQYYRWTSYVPVDPDLRLRLADTLFKSNQPSAAAVQIRMAAQQRPLHAEELLMRAECELRLGLYDEALSSVNLCLELSPTMPEALAEKANILYLLNRFEELRDHLRTSLLLMPTNAVLWGLYGNAWYSLGNWAKAATAYETALVLDPEEPLYRMNAARAFERCGRGEPALRRYLDAAGEFFRREMYDDVTAVLASVKDLDEGNEELRVLSAKMLFHAGDLKGAEQALEPFVDTDHGDSSVDFLYGLALALTGRRMEADRYLERAACAEPDYPLYWFRLAENRYLSSKDPNPALEQALRADPHDPWILNLAGIVEIDRGNTEEAVRLLEEAIEHAPQEWDIRANLAEALFAGGRESEAHAVAAETSGDARAHNLLGNLHARAGRYEQAVGEYERALREASDDAFRMLVMENCASACVEIDMINRAEELLIGVLEAAPTARAYNLMGHVAQFRGEHRRAEEAYRAARSAEPKNCDYRLNLADILITRMHFDAARELLTGVEASERAEKLKRRLRDMTQVSLSCAACGRRWWAPREIGPQPRMKLVGEPPGESPAGRCMQCGKIYCIACAEAHVKDGRFVCPDCNLSLKLADDRLKYLVASYVE